MLAHAKGMDVVSFAPQTAHLWVKGWISYRLAHFEALAPRTRRKRSRFTGVSSSSVPGDGKS